jgi:hypothetical protein
LTEAAQPDRPREGLTRFRWLIILGLLATGMAIQFTTFINQDLAWITYSARWLLHGAAFGRDLLDPNPPLAWYLALPEAYLWETWGIDPGVSTALICAALVMAVLCYLDRLPSLYSAYFPRRPVTIVILALAYWLMIGCADGFGQREYLGVLFGLPHLLLSPSRYRGLVLSSGAAIAIGLLAGVGYSLKPNFLVVPVVVELASMAHFRRVGPLFRIENWALGLFAVTYAALIVILVPAYVTDMVPFVVQYYWAFERSWEFVILSVGAFIVILLIDAYLCAKGARSDLQLSLIPGAAAFLASYLAQHKGYTYHALPFKMLAMTSALLVLLSPDWVREKAVRHLALVAVAVGWLLSMFQVGQWYRSANVMNGGYAAETRQLIRVLDRHAAGHAFLALTSHPYPGFPTALYANAVWGSRADSLHYLPAVARLRAGDRAVGAADRDITERKAWDALRSDLQRSQPAVIFLFDPPDQPSVEEVAFDILGFYREDPTIDAIWRDYMEADRTPNYRVFVRAGSPGM